MPRTLLMPDLKNLDPSVSLAYRESYGKRQHDEDSVAIETIRRAREDPMTALDRSSAGRE
jgi:hypothetical protein